MQLMTKELEGKLPKLRTETNDDTLVLVHYFNPAGRGNWFGMTYDPKERMFFGYVSLFGDWNDELGYFSLDELESLKLPLGLSIERNLGFNPKPLKDIKNEYTRA